MEILARSMPIEHATPKREKAVRKAAKERAIKEEDQ